jgi:hypothetical protein
LKSCLRNEAASYEQVEGPRIQVGPEIKVGEEKQIITEEIEVEYWMDSCKEGSLEKVNYTEGPSCKGWP